MLFISIIPFFVPLTGINWTSSISHGFEHSASFFYSQDPSIRSYFIQRNLRRVFDVIVSSSFSHPMSFNFKDTWFLTTRANCWHLVEVDGFPGSPTPTRRLMMLWSVPLAERYAALIGVWHIHYLWCNTRNYYFAFITQGHRPNSSSTQYIGKLILIPGQSRLRSEHIRGIPPMWVSPTPRSWFGLASKYLIKLPIDRGSLILLHCLLWE